MANKAESRREVGRLEWLVAALGLAITVGVFATLGYEAAIRDDGPPVLVARVLDVTAGEGGHVVRFVTENRGPSTAAEVVVRATLRQGDDVVEQAETTLDYVARKSSREAGVILRRDPRSASLELFAVSYRKP